MSYNDDIEQKIDMLFNYIREDGGIFDLPWCTTLLYPYYKHFNDDNLKHRIGSLIAFQGLLQEWEDGSGFPFSTGKEAYPCHDFQKYIETFIKFSREIKLRFPNTYYLTIDILKTLDNKHKIEDKFPNIDKRIIIEAKKFLFDEAVNITDSVYLAVLNEAGITI